MTHENPTPQTSDDDDTYEGPDVERSLDDAPTIGENLESELDDSADSYVSPARTDRSSEQ